MEGEWRRGRMADEDLERSYGKCPNPRGQGDREMPDENGAIVIRKTKYRNNIVEQDHRGVKRVTRPM